MDEKKVHIKYRLDFLPGDKFAFQILEQSDEVTNFLKNKNFSDETTGWRVAIGDFPEVQDSKNVIWLRAGNKKDTKVDITRTVGGMQRRNRSEGVHMTLKHLVAAVKKAAGDDDLKQKGIYTA